MLEFAKVSAYQAMAGSCVYTVTQYGTQWELRINQLAGKQLSKRFYETKQECADAANEHANHATG